VAAATTLTPRKHPRPTVVGTETCCLATQIARHLLRIFDRGAQERRAAEGQPRPIPEHGIAAEDRGQRVKRHTPLPQVESFFDLIGARHHVGHNERRAQGEDSPGRLQCDPAHEQVLFDRPIAVVKGKYLGKIKFTFCMHSARYSHEEV